MIETFRTYSCTSVCVICRLKCLPINYKAKLHDDMKATDEVLYSLTTRPANPRNSNAENDETDDDGHSRDGH